MFSDDVWIAAAALPIEARARFLTDSATVIARQRRRTAMLIDKFQRAFTYTSDGLDQPG